MNTGILKNPGVVSPGLQRDGSKDLESWCAAAHGVAESGMA